MFILLGLIIAVILVATFLFISSLDTNQDVAANSEIQFPDNSTGKAVPRLYGKHRVYGNCIYVSPFPTTYPIRIDDGGK